MSDQDLIAKLNLLAEISTEGTGYAPDEHIAGIAADRIAKLETLIERMVNAYPDWRDEYEALEQNDDSTD